MSLLDSVQKGRQNLPPRLLIYGTEGIGKSTLANQAPNAIFIQTEDGLREIDCAKFPKANTLQDVQAYINALIVQQHNYHTVVIDTADWLERLIWDDLCGQYGVSNIEKVDGGYARGYTHALTPLRHILDGLDNLNAQKKMCIILLAHHKVEKFEDPVHGAYDRYCPKLHKHANAVIKEWADAILFATQKVITKNEDTGFNRTRTLAAGLGKDGGKRVLLCIGSPSYVAKNRYNLPMELPLDWNALMQALAAGRKASVKETPAHE